MSTDQNISFTKKYERNPIDYEHLRPPLKSLNKQYNGNRRIFIKLKLTRRYQILR